MVRLRRIGRRMRPPLGGHTAEVQAASLAQEEAAAGPGDISQLLAQALDAYWREAAGGEGAAQAAPRSEADVGELITQALAAVAPRTEEPLEEADSGRHGTGRGVQETQAHAMGSGVMEPSGEPARVEGLEDWMWEWREYRQVVPGEPCPAGLLYNMDPHAGTSCARLPDNLRARLDAAEAARGGGADERPLAPFPSRPDTPPAVILAGDKAEEEQEAEKKGDEEAYGPGEPALALMYEDDAKPDVHAGMDVDQTNAPLLPMPTAVLHPPMESCEQRHCRCHAAEGAHRHCLVDTGQREVGMLASALERYEFQRPGHVAREMDLVAGSPDDGQVRCVQLGDAAVLGHHPGDVRAAEPQRGIPLSVRLSVGRLLDETGLEDVRRDDCLYVALWRGGADDWRREQAVRPLTPQALGSHALLVALHPEGAEVVFNTDRLPLAGDGLVLVPTSGSYRLESRGGDLRLLVLVGTRSRWGVMTRQAMTLMRWGRSSPRRGSRSTTSRRRPRRRWTYRPLWRRPGGGSRLQQARRRPRRRWRTRTNVGGVTRQRTPWSRTRSRSSWGQRRHMRWDRKSWEWRTRLGRRWGRWKPAGTGPRGGACGPMPADMPTSNRPCRREYPSICS